MPALVLHWRASRTASAATASAICCSCGWCRCFPFWLVNIVPALLGMRLGPYTLATLIGIIPAAFVYAGVGASFGALFDRGEAPNLSIIFEWRILLPLLGLAALALVPVLYTHLRRGKASS